MAIKIFSETIEVPIEDIHPNNWNPNFVADDIMAAIEDDIVKNGFVRPILLQKHNEGLDKDNVIIDGMHRFEIFKKLGGEKIPAIIIDIPDANAKALTIRLNREHGELLPNRLGELLYEMSQEDGRDLSYLQELTYIPQNEVQSLLDIRDKEMMDSIKDSTKESKQKMVKCPECGTEFPAK